MLIEALSLAVDIAGMIESVFLVRFFMLVKKQTATFLAFAMFFAGILVAMMYLAVVDGLVLMGYKDPPFASGLMVRFAVPLAIVVPMSVLIWTLRVRWTNSDEEEEGKDAVESNRGSPPDR